MESKKYKILFLLHTPPPVHGSSMVGKWIKDSKLINITFRCGYINLLASRKVSENGIVTFSKIFNFIVIFLKLFISLLKSKPDICYLALTTTGVAFYRDVLLVGLLRLFRVKRLYHLHNKGVGRIQNSKISVFFLSFVFKGADVILLSKYLYSDIQNYVQERNIHICPNGIPEIEKKKLKTKNSEQINILFLSNLIASKGVYELLEVCSLLKISGYSFFCDFIGSEGDINRLQFDEEVKRLDIQDVVKYHGPKYGTEKQKFYYEADMFIHPTMNDCFPLVILEAMQFSIPVISTFEGGIPDIVVNNTTGLLVQPGNTDELYDKVKLLLLDKDLRDKMGVEGRFRYENKFTIEIFEQNICSILNKCLAK